MFAILGNLLIGLAATVIAAVLSYRKPTDTLEAGEVDFPKAEEGDEIGKVFGTVWVEDPQVHWFGDIKTVAIVEKGPRRYGLFGPRRRTTVGYRYFLGVHFILSLGPIERLLRIDVNKRRIWIGNLREAASAYINKPEIFGGTKREGGIQGTLDFLPGYATQTANPYLASKLGAVPAFRGVSSVVLQQMYIGTTNYPKPWAFQVQRVFVGDGGAAQWNPTTAGISRGITFRNAAIYVAFDASGSMAGSFWDGQIAALQGFLEAVRDNNDPDEPNDLILARFDDSLEATITLRNMTAADYDTAINWLAGQAGPSGATNYEAAVSAAPAFFDGAAPDKDRILIFLTDGQPTDGSLSNAVATVQGVEGLDVYAFNINLTDTSATSQLDNTPEDGVPIVTGGDPSALINAFARVFSLGFDMNPAHILREVLIARDTNGSGDAAEIGPSFAAAADTLFAEEFMLSIFWRSTGDKASFVREIEEHIDGRVYQDRRTGLWELRLIRRDYNVATLPLFDRTNVIEWGDDIEWPDPASLPNQVTITFTDWRKNEPASITLTNPARVQSIGRVINRKKDYPGITSSKIAARVAARELEAASSPLLSGSIRVRFLDPSLNLGSPIKLHNPRIGIENVVVRITEINDGDGRRNGAEIRFIEDRFTLPSSELVEVEEIDNPITVSPSPALNRLVEEATYWQVQFEVGQAELDAELATTPGLGWLNVTAQAPAGGAFAYDAWIDTGSGYSLAIEDEAFCPVATLRSNMTPRADHVNVLVDAGEVADFRIGSIARIGDEYVRIDAIQNPGTWGAGDYWSPPTTPTGPVARLTVGRGCLDTSPAEHFAGEVAIAWQEAAATDDVAYTAGTVASVKLLPTTTAGTLSIDAAPVDVVTFDSRAIRPYPPGRVQVAGSYAAPAAWAGTLAITWAHRSRLLQTDATFDDHTATSIGPEAGTTYRVRVWPLDINGAPYGSPLLDVGGISGTSYNLDTAGTPSPAGAWGMRVEVRSERGGYVSTRNRSIDVPVIVTPAMLPGGTWLDLNDLGSVWQDVEGTVAVTTDGQPIGLIENQRPSII